MNEKTLKQQLQKFNSGAASKHMNLDNTKVKIKINQGYN